MAVFSKENLPEDELKEEFICSAAGPGGQHVNKTATAVRLAFHAAESKILNERTRNRLYALAGDTCRGRVRHGFRQGFTQPGNEPRSCAGTSCGVDRTSHDRAAKTEKDQTDQSLERTPPEIEKYPQQGEKLALRAL